MNEWENYLYILLAFLILALCVFLWRKKLQKKYASSRQKYLLQTLELAQKQFAEFNLKLPDAVGNQAGFSGLLEEFSSTELMLDVNGCVPDEWNKKIIEAYFRAQREEGPVFYAFNTHVEKVDSDYQNSHLTLAMPEELRIEKKRHFIRVKPDKDDIRVIGVWKIKPGKRLPRSTTEIGSPSTHYKPGMESEPVQVEDISGAGLALRFSSENYEELEKEFPKGIQILCLVVYVLEEKEKPIAFWCTGEIMNSRIKSGTNPELILGLEFTNWAILESATSEIHWAHSSPSKGVKPMLQWVGQIEKKNPLIKRK